MTSLRRTLSTVILLAVIPAMAWAGYRVNVTAPQGFADGIFRIAFVPVECGGGLNCRDIEQQVLVV
jgi:hypothetical protein